MTNKEIENKRNKLIQIVNMPNTGKPLNIPNSDKKADSGQVYRFKELRKLALEVGASHISTERQKTANEGELVVGIQDVLQTAASINMAKKAEKAEGSVRTMPARSSKDNWKAIESEFGISKNNFGRKINFVSDSFKRKIIFRDVEHAFVLASQGFSKPALILAGGVIEELLRLYMEQKKIKPKNKRFVDYVKACEDNGLLKRGVSRLTDSVRDFRNLVHLDNEEIKKHTISKATAKGAVASIFTIANDL